MEFLPYFNSFLSFLDLKQPASIPDLSFHRYYQCAHGIPYEYSCNAGTFWNPAIQNCDYEANVDCQPCSTDTGDQMDLSSYARTPCPPYKK